MTTPTVRGGVRLGHYRFVPRRLLLFLVLVQGTGCATGPATRPPPSEAVAPPPAAVAPPPNEMTPSPEVVAPSPSTVTPSPGSAVPPSVASRLPWVNPSRCLPSCAAHPASGLIRINDRGELDARGRHRVDRAAQAALGELMAAARAAGHRLRVQSGFRSYEDQARVFATTDEIGRAARPGHSEHQLGTAIDLRLPTSAAIVWLASHAPPLGFVLSYPAGKQRVTGYRPEPWHVRFVGRALAQEIQAQGVSLEELFRARPDLGQSGTCADCPLPASAAPCGDLTASGRCEGSVLLWCYDGAAAAVDCAISAERCGATAGGEYSCR